jgi:hypothetical protein
MYESYSPVDVCIDQRKGACLGRILYYGREIDVVFATNSRYPKRQRFVGRVYRLLNSQAGSEFVETKGIM